MFTKVNINIRYSNIEGKDTKGIKETSLEGKILAI